MTPLERYRELEKELIVLRTASNGHYTVAEGDVIDGMTRVWYELTLEEQDILDSEGPQAPNRLGDENA